MQRKRERKSGTYNGLGQGSAKGVKGLAIRRQEGIAREKRANLQRAEKRLVNKKRKNKRGHEKRNEAQRCIRSTVHGWTMKGRKQKMKAIKNEWLSIRRTLNGIRKEGENSSRKKEEII